MPRVARIVVPGLPHHVVQRGNNRQDVFFVDDDRRAYLKFLLEESRLHGVEVLGWCLMTNHTHQIVVPTRAESLARAIGRAHWRYAQYVNRLHKRSGHVWQNRFYSAAFEWEHLSPVMRYVECNPLRARLCRKPWLYPWSSAAAHCDEAADASGLIDPRRWTTLIDASGVQWRGMLLDPLEKPELTRIRSTILTGRPLASDGILARLETKLGRRLRALPVGRPKTAKRKPGRAGPARGTRK
jgi:putative transposase